MTQVGRAAQRECRKQINQWSIEELRARAVGHAHEWDRQNLIAALQRLWKPMDHPIDTNTSMVDDNRIQKPLPSSFTSSSSSSTAPKPTMMSGPDAIDKSESVEKHVEKLLQQRMEASRTRSPIVLAALASALHGGCGEKKTWELLESQGLHLLPQMGPREMSHLAYAASQKRELRHLLKEIENAASLRLPEFSTRSLCHLAFATKNPQFLVAIAQEIGERDMDEFQPNEIAQAMQSFAYAREPALAIVEAQVIQVAPRFHPREWATVLWALRDGKRQRALEQLLELLPSGVGREKFFGEWKLLELVCLYDIVAENRAFRRYIRQVLESRRPKTMSEFAAMLRIRDDDGNRITVDWDLIQSLPVDDYNGLAQVCSCLSDKSFREHRTLVAGMELLIAKLTRAIKDGQVEHLGVIELGGRDTRTLLDALTIPHVHLDPSRVVMEEGIKTTCQLERRNASSSFSSESEESTTTNTSQLDPSMSPSSSSSTSKREEPNKEDAVCGPTFELMHTFTAGYQQHPLAGEENVNTKKKSGLRACHLSFDRRKDAEFQALEYIMLADVKASKRLVDDQNQDEVIPEYRLKVSRIPCLSCIWALWQVRKHRSVSISFPDSVEMIR